MTDVQQSRVYKSDWNVCSTFRGRVRIVLGPSSGTLVLTSLSSVFSALRTYALQRKRSWAVIVLILLLAPVIVAAVSGVQAVALMLNAPVHFDG